ncbi:MAG: RluA family pseudouridine synthase [Candidatus Gastranaerophilales bacterium]|nr:RluA family pseudouridine synthase [Candidatus Gastranaerophilales bacterium]
MAIYDHIDNLAEPESVAAGSVIINLMTTQREIRLEVELDEAGTRLDVYITRLLPDFSRSRVQRLIDEDAAVLVNGKPSKNSFRLSEGDEVVINVPEARELELTPEDILLDIRYEDENMLVVNKPAGMLTHPSAIEREHTLVNALLYYCKGNLSGINGVMRPGILHRLDRETSGLLMIAKNDFAHRVLSDQIRTREAKRSYYAFVEGVMKEDSGVINKPIDRHPTQKHKMAVVEGGKHAITHWKVLQRFEKATLVEATLDTGRTHQIRVHFSHINHPVIGDPLYGARESKVKTTGQALQAYRLSFIKPGTDERITIEIDPDEDIKKLLRVFST